MTKRFGHYPVAFEGEGKMLRFLSVRRYLPVWLRSGPGDFYLDTLAFLAAAAELTYWLAHHW
jgi:hypothetical protein